MKSLGIYNNLEKELKNAKITRYEVSKALNIGINTITRKLSIPSSIYLVEAIQIRDLIAQKTTKFHSLEYLFVKE